ncbi:hypothetical protein C5C49_09500 [Rathayibacter sp. AY1E2]|nr:hypothetical protein C5B98_09195 [Rathayibacter sp. AY1A5]PPH52309.1 hypothetical protein C5C49_09500 [Rathayibacter sp. AY1E2]
MLGMGAIDGGGQSGARRPGAAPRPASGLRVGRVQRPRPDRPRPAGRGGARPPGCRVRVAEWSGRRSAS